MVAVRDEERERLHRRHNPLNRRRVGHSPQPMVAPVAVLDGDARGASVHPFQGPDDVSRRIGVKREDRAEVAATRLQELIAVVLRRGAGVLVGEDTAGAELLQLDQREKAGNRPPRTGAQPGLSRVQVDRRASVPPEDPVAQPRIQAPLGAGVAVVLQAVARMLPAEVQPDDVAGMPVVERRLLGRSDHIAGRRYHGRNGAHLGRVIQDAAKWDNLRHETSLYDNQYSSYMKKSDSSRFTLNTTT